MSAKRNVFGMMVLFVLAMGLFSPAQARGVPPHDGLEIYDVMFYDARIFGYECVYVDYLNIRGIERERWMTPHELSLFKQRVRLNQKKSKAKAKQNNAKSKAKSKP